MARELKVFRFTTWNHAVKPREGGNGNRQADHVVAAYSLAEVMRLSGMSRSELTNYGGVTGNPEQIAVAMSEPGIIFFRGIDEHSTGPESWNRMEPKPEELTTFGWTDTRPDATPEMDHKERSARFIVAAKSWAEAARIMGTTVDAIKYKGHRSYSAGEDSKAQANPRVVLWRPAYEQGEWTAISS